MRFRCESCGAQYAISDDKLGKKGVKVRCKKCSNIITVRPPSPEPESSEEDSQEPVAEEEQRDTTSVDGDPSAPQEQDAQESESQSELPQDSEAEEESLSSQSSEGFDLGDDDDLHDALNGLLGDDGLGDELGDEEDDDEDMDRQATRVFNVEEMQQVQAEREQAVSSDEETKQNEIGEDYTGAGQGEDAQGEQDRDKVEWYAAVDDEQVGPISLNEFAKRWKSGEFDSDTLVWKSGFEDWLTIYDVADFAFLAEEEASMEDEESDSWSPSFGAQSESEELGDDQEREEELDEGYGDEGYGDEEDEGEGDYSGFDDEESSSAASSAAFAADVDWKPAALSSLSDLAEQELASLKPEDPEPEEELPFDADGEIPSGEGVDFDADMEDGDSSLVAQIAAEEEAIRRAQEEDEKEAQSSEAESDSDESIPEMDAQEKARKEKRAEQVVAASVPEERYIPPRGSLPKWAIGLMVGGGLMMLTLVGVVGYLLARETTTEKVIQPVVATNTQNASAKTKPVAVPSGNTKTQSTAKKVTGDNKQESAGTQAANGVKAAAANGADAQKPTEEAGSVKKTDEVKVASVQNSTKSKDTTKAQAKKPRTPRKHKPITKKPRKNKNSTRLAMNTKKEEVEAKPKPKRKKPKGGLLDFEDPDDRAFAAETGIKAPKTAPKVQKKKELPPLSNADVLTVMKRHLAEFKACNRKQKQVDSSVRGKMVVSFTIANNGRVVRVGVSKKTAKFKGTYVGGCIKGIIKRLKFPEFGGPKKTIPFPFTVN